MESFSEDEFLWTDTSKDSISTVDDIIEETTVSDHARTEAQSKHKMHQEPVKAEPESECDTVLKKKKKRKCCDNGDYQNDASYDESYLDMKVKEEDRQATSYKENKKKKKKHKSENDDSQTTDDQGINIGLSHENIHLKQESESELQFTKSKKKKKKSEASDCDAIAEFETHNKTMYKKKEDKKLSNKKLENSMDWDSNENNSDEISDIKGEEDHNLNTILVDNKTTVVNDKYNKDSSTAGSSRKPRISDRLRFEDDDDTANECNQVTENENIVQSSKFKRFLKQNSHLKLITPKPQDSSSFFKNDDLWIIRCPKDIEINDMNGLIINLNGKSKIKVGGQTYDCNTEDKTVAATVMNMKRNKFHIQNSTVTGTVQIRRRIPKLHVFENNVMTNNQTNFIPLPEIKCRHPLFGSNYKKAIKVPKAISERLNTIKLKRNEVHVHKKKNSKNNTNITPDKDESVETKSEEVTVKKKRKRKLTEKDFQDQSPPALKKPKRIKHDPESSEAWASEKAIEENLFNY